MRVIDAFKAFAQRVVENILAAIERLTTQDVVITSGGEIIVKEPVVRAIADKLSAVVIAASALFFLLSPIQSKAAMEIGDQLLRAATMLWSGSAAVPGTTFAT